ncbi:unnamed protein product [Blepharisma stoltei]|uniref:Uncharacterized protein n=1 Tax=Blepharisma stoltei TaxID=1481888 RepID=A0AAU9J155_9CILI|nr:unnamed protein product [Blepharisma stoltei]
MIINSYHLYFLYKLIWKKVIFLTTSKKPVPAKAPLKSTAQKEPPAKSAGKPCKPISTRSKTSQKSRATFHHRQHWKSIWILL